MARLDGQAGSTTPGALLPPWQSPGHPGSASQAPPIFHPSLSPGPHGLRYRLKTKKLRGAKAKTDLQVNFLNFKNTRLWETRDSHIFWCCELVHSRAV